MSDTIKYFDSKNVKMFPSAYRANNYSISWLPTEQNWLVGAGKKAGKNTYVIAADIDGSNLNSIKFVLGGYYFDITEELKNYKEYALAIKVIDGNITDNNTTYTQSFLAPYESDALVCLDMEETVGGTIKFKGLAIVKKNEVSGASEFLLLDNLEKYYVIETSIQHSTGKHSFESTVEDEDTVNDVNGNYSVALGHANKIDSNESFAFGSNNTIENANSIVVGKSNTTNKEATYLFGQNLKNETSNNKVVIGNFNEDTNGSVFEIGTGTTEDNRKNVLTVQRTKTTLNSEIEINADSKQISYTGPKLTVNNLVKLDNNNLEIDTDTNNFTGNVDIDGTTQIDNDNFSVGSTSTKKIATNATNTTINNNEVNVVGKTTITGETAINGNTSITGDTVTVTGATTINGNTTIVGDSVDYKQTSGGNSFFSAGKEKTSIKTPASIDKLAIGQDAVDDTAKLVVNGDEKVGAIVASGNITAPSINITGTELSSLGEGLKKLLLDATYPIGSVYIYSKDAIVSQCPIQSSLGGTWAAIEGKFLYAKDSSHTMNNTGGTSKGYLLDHTHTAGLQEDIKDISTNEAGKHKHAILVDANNWHTGQKNQDVSHNIDAFDLDWEHGTRVPEDGWYGDGDGNGNEDTGGCLKAAGAHSHTFNISKDKVRFTTLIVDTITGGEKITTENNEANMPPYLVVQMWKRTA